MNTLKKSLIRKDRNGSYFSIEHSKKFFTISFIVICLLLSTFRESKAQAASGIYHTFGVSTPVVAFPGTFTSIAVPAVDVDEYTTLLNQTQLPGWTFTFAGTSYNSVVISSNGWLALVPANPAANPLPYPANSLPANTLNNNTTGFPIVAPLWDDLSTSLIRYNLTGNTLSVQWYVKWQKTNATAVTSLFWVELNGTTNTIVLRYANNTLYVPATPTASIGIAGKCPGDFYSVSCQSATTATVDSLVENTNIGAVGPGNSRPYNVNFTFTPNNPYDNCTGASFPALNLGTINSTCTNKLVSTVNATTSGLGGNCGGADIKDVWFSFIKPFGSSNIQVTTTPAACGSVTGTSVELYAACGGPVIICANSSTGNPTYAELLNVARNPCVIETLYVRVTAAGDIAGKFNICVKDNSPAVGQTCAAPAPVCLPLPFNYMGGTTLGSINNYNDTNLCTSVCMTGQDYIFSFTPAVTGCYTISIDGTGVNSFPGLFITDLCPSDTINGHCIASEVDTSFGDTINNITLVGGQQYFITVDNNANAAGTSSMPFNLHVTNAAGAGPPNDPCAGAASLGSIATNAVCATTTSAQFTTLCANPTPLPVPNPVCGGMVPNLIGDVWFTFTTSFSGILQITAMGSGLNPVRHGGMALYSGTCGSLTLIQCAGDSVAIPYMPVMSVGVTSATTYYLRFWSSPGFEPGTFKLCFDGNCAPPNDFPVNAISLPLNTPTLGDNTCSTGLNEMAQPLLCTSAPVNTVWYTVITPPSGQVAVRISQLSMQDAAVGAFTFPTGPANAASSFTRVACNDDIIFAAPAPICGMTGDNDAAIQYTAPAGSTIYIAVDGEGGSVGSFYITAIDGNLTTPFPPVYRKDCANPEQVCANNNYYLPNGGIGSDGNICDFQNLTCSGGATVSEVGSAWLTFTVTAGSTLGFTITPNDSASPVANFNFFLWDITNIANICSALSSTAPIRCNTTAGTGKTGCRTPVTTVFASTVPAQLTNHTYMLYVQNLTSANDDEGVPGTNTGFTMDWGIYTGGVLTGYTGIVGTSANSYWQGPVVDNAYQNLANWKGIGTCPAVLPSCTTDVFISAASQDCNVTTNSYCKNITINPGGVLRILPGGTLHVCGDYINNGSLIASVGATISFEGSVNQSISGFLTGANGYANLVVLKLNSTPVTLMGNIDVNGDFTTSNATSVFSINGKYMKLGGHFNNASGNTTFINYPTSTLEFNGLYRQNFNNLLTPITLNRVKMNKPAQNLYLNTSMSNMNIDSGLVMTSGKINTRLNTLLEVNMKYYLPASISGYSAISYIDGNLRRKIANPTGPASPAIPASYDFPVGDSLNAISLLGGYELANITFSTSTLVFDLLAYFTPWPAGPPILGPAAFECPSYTYDVLPMFNNGYWTFKRSTTTFGGNYNINLYNTGFNNNTGTFWTVAKANLLAPPSTAGSWRLKGACVVGSTAANTQRTAMNAPAADSTSFNSLYATAQSNVLLPIELLYFNAEPNGDIVLCKWETASETNNDHFEVERSINGMEFEFVGKVAGCGPGVCSESRSYSLNDEQTCVGVVYYRLKQVDIDGNFAYSEVIALDCNNRSHINVHPNPAQSSITLSYNEVSNGNVTVSIIDYTGRVVYRNKFSAKKGQNQQTISIENLSDGAYYLDIHSDNTDQSVHRQIRFFKELK